MTAEGSYSFAFCMRLLTKGCMASFACLAFCIADSKTGLSFITLCCSVYVRLYAESSSSSSCLALTLN